MFKRIGLWASAFFLLGVSASYLPAKEWQVIDEESGHPIAYAQVIQNGAVMMTDGEGKFEGRDAPVMVKASGYKKADQTEGNVVKLTPFQPRGVYLSHFGVSSSKIFDRAMELVSQGNVNTFVIDVKNDQGYVSFDTGLESVRSIRADRYKTIKDVHALLARLKEHGIYTIARVAVFRDDTFARAYPEDAVWKPQGRIFQDNQKMAWADPFSAKAKRYNLDIAGAAAKAGFDEIQFDYIRFPDHNGLVYLKESHEKSRTNEIASFLKQAKKRLDPLGVYVSAAVFGYTIWDQGDVGLGQQLERIAPLVDYLAPMLYPSGFSEGIPMHRNPIASSFEIIYLSLERARERTNLPANHFRPWLQAFRDYAFNRAHFKADRVAVQTEAARFFGSNGWLLWNPRNNYQSAFIGEEKLFLTRQ